MIVGSATDALRLSDAPLWRVIRDELRGMNVDPMTSRVLDSYDEGDPRARTRHEVGIVLASDRRFLRYDVRYRGDVARGRFQWTDVTATWPETEHAKWIERALEAGSDEPAPPASFTIDTSGS